MKKIFKYIAGIAIASTVLAGCGKGFLDINENPNRPVTATPNLILTSGLNRTSALVSTTLNEIGSVWAGYWAPATDYLWYINNKQYNVTPNFGTAVFETSFDILSDFQAVQDAAVAANMNYYQGIAGIMKAYHFQNLVDAYNNVPYTEALKNTQNIRPKYDEGQAIYDDLIKQLDAAIALIKSAPETEAKPQGEDIYFAGNMTNWIKFANTLKLRILLRQSEIPGKDATIKAEIAKIVSEGSGFSDAGVYGQPGYTSSATKMNPFWEGYYANSAGSATSNYKATRPTKYIVNNYLSNNDPRIDQMYLKVSGAFKGIELGRNTGDSEAALYKSSVTSAFLTNGGILKSATQKAVIMLPSESLFLQAEAVARGWMTGDAKALYNKAIEESFVFLGVPDAAAAAATYAGQAINKVGYDASTNKVEAIIYQKWLALNSVSGWEAWTEFRRTKFPTDNPLSLNAIKPIHPKRLVYPSSEYGRNGDEVEKQGDIDTFTSKIFWDTK
ncbi:SusD/RagB family nutrient-binding outer membrane lipoprotein [Sphingobacterium sp. PU5-4]|uniref:SusD/RagB family nutrient-binding outer membrane lipoprotein n=1 Tax=Sphingobacterium tenebrionis TaxID=3111775 RepID=A0ABU8I3H5_9SPHI